MWSYFSLYFFVFFGAISTTPIPNDRSSRIVNGYDVDITEVPYQASLRRKSTSGWVHTCGAVIIDQRALLTAAHCVESFVNNPSQLRVVCGTNSRVSGGKNLDVTKIVVHESYAPAALQNDIALLLTHKKISFNEGIMPVPYAPMDFELDDGAPALVSGFGVTNYEGSVATVLQAARVYIINQEKCVLAYFRMAEVTKGMVCAMATDPPRDACQGDSGGPLVSNGYLIGLVSWGESCADSQYPGVYTRVSQYNHWITNTLDVELENI